MKPKRYLYSGKIKTSTMEIVKAWETAYSEFFVENQRAQEAVKQELDKATQKLYSLCH